ncbi:SDR family NAD(P)-dependent oxidoreductase [Snuella sedimenti]|uniref:SDR family oxidoreductase n=1 Tax=Snuella sedimenti TaxID=2798802 RepID=A0A8J7J2R7_9FLAO|nr:SDR family oxidoreductase [Snuella sedimenti]MBJ6368632.1 SDR family oxidoreductase [Snuella sedimenti]
MNKIENIVDLTDRVALITGGGSGIGLGIAKQFIALGAKVVITGRDQKKLEEAKTILGANCFYFTNDVTKKEEHENLVQSIEEKIGAIQILVNNAGRHSKKPSLEATDGEFQEIMDTNVNSVFVLTRTVLKYMITRKKGSVINISSMTALYGIPLVVAYSSSKTALLGMTRTLASEYSHTGVRFNAIAPGFIESKMFRNAMAQDPERERKILSRTPAQRFGSPSDIAKAAAFLASDASEFITGICLPVDGGNSIGF